MTPYSGHKQERIHFTATRLGEERITVFKPGFVERNDQACDSITPPSVTVVPYSSVSVKELTQGRRFLHMHKGPGIWLPSLSELADHPL